MSAKAESEVKPMYYSDGDGDVASIKHMPDSSAIIIITERTSLGNWSILQC